MANLDWAKTSLKPYIEHFKGFVNGLDLEARRKLRRMLHVQFSTISHGFYGAMIPFI
jgi:hypothetical protein